MSKLLTIVKRNDLVQASYSLSVSETRVILLCLAKISSKEPLPLDYEFTITASDFHDELGLDKDNAYRDLREAVDRLWKREILIDVNDPGSMVRWISKKAYFTSKGSVNIAFSAQIMPYLTELKGRYTSYELKEVASFNNAYSVRFYELIVQFKDNQKRRIAISDLRDMLDIGNKYTAIKDFKKRVIMPALADINEYSNVTVELEQEKQGKVITHFIFNYSIKPIIRTKTTKTSTRTKPLVPLFEGHPDYVVDTPAILAEHEEIKNKPVVLPKIIDEPTQQRIAGLKKATKGI